MGRKNKVERKVGKTSEQEMKKGLDLIREGKSIHKAAEAAGIPYPTLRRYWIKSKTSSEPIKLVPQYDINRVFTVEQEKALKEYIVECASLFYGLSTVEVRNIAFQMAEINKIKMPQSWHVKRIAGVDWLRGFRQRHLDISLRKPEACSLARASAFNKINVDAFFDNLESVLKRDVAAFSDGLRIFNLDETSTTNVQRPLKVLAPKGKRNLCSITSAEKGTLVTTCCIISAGGQALPPVMVFPRKKFLPRMLKGAPPGTLGLANPSGWMISDLFVEVIKHFIRHSSSSQENPSILIFDNHESHLSIEALDLAKKSGVTIVTLHPHTSAKLQPLDVGVFAPFKSFYNSAVESWLLRNPGIPLTIYEIGELVGYAFPRAMTQLNIVNAFKKTGIYPFDRNVFSDEDFLPSNVTDRDYSKQPLNMVADAVNVSTPSTSTQAELIDNEPLATFRATTVSGPTKNSDNLSVPMSKNKESRQILAAVSATGASFISPKQFRNPIKAGPRKNKRKPRPLGRSLVATDTPEKAEIENQRRAAKKRKEAKNKRTVRTVFASSSEEEVEIEFQDTDDDVTWSDENEENEIPVLTEDMLTIGTPLPKIPEEGEYVLVLFATKKQRIYYVGKILQTRNESLEYYITFLRLKSIFQEQLFYFPDIADISFVKEEDIIYLLPNPVVAGSTTRQHSYYKFSINFNLNIR